MKPDQLSTCSFFCILIASVSIASVSGYSVKKTIDTEELSETTQETLLVTSHDDISIVTDGATEEQQVGDDSSDTPLGFTTDTINDEDNEISRAERDTGAVTEKVPYEASANDETTTQTGTSYIEDNWMFVRPITPDPNAEYDGPTVNPLPEGYDRAQLMDVNLTGPAIQGFKANCLCGKPSARIVGGEPASIRQYPWMVGLTRGSGRPYCGGTLINSRYVVTASHCVDGSTASRITVVINEQDFASSSEAGARPQSIRVERIIMHQNYNNKNIDNDIALLRLAEDLPLSSGRYIPACLPSSNANDFSSETATVTGWGATSGGGATSSSLRKVSVPVISNRDCNTKSKYNGKITENMMCAGLLATGGKDSCQGDSGGPLIIGNGGRSTLIGIVSWGYGCAQPNSPGVYTRVARYPDWILANTRGADWCTG